MKKGFGDLFSETINEYRKKFLSILNIFLFLYLIPIIVFMVIIVILVVILIAGSSFSEFQITNFSLASITGFATSEMSNAPAGLLIILIPIILILFLALVYFLLLETISILLVGFSKKELLFNEIFRNARKYFWKYLGLIIVQLIFLLGLFLLLIIPGIIFFVYWIFSNYVLINEKTDIMQSLKRSKEIVKGRWWGVFGYFILIIIIYVGSSIIISFIPLANLIVSQLVLIPFLILFLKNFYLDLKTNPVRKRK